MEDKLIKMDYERGKAIFLREITDSNGEVRTMEIEVDIPNIPTTEGIIRKVKKDKYGRIYETEQVIHTPVFDKYEEGK